MLFKSKADNDIKELNKRLESQVSNLEYIINKQDNLVNKCNELQGNYFELYKTFLAMQNSIRIMKATVDQHKNKGCGLEGCIGDYPTYVSEFLDSILKIGEDL